MSMSASACSTSRSSPSATASCSPATVNTERLWLGVGRPVEEEHARDGGQGVREALDDVEAPALGDVGHAFDEHAPMLQARARPPERRPCAARPGGAVPATRPGARAAVARRDAGRGGALAGSRRCAVDSDRMTGQPRSLLRHPDFLKLWTAETISVFGSQISALAIPLIAVLSLEVSPFEVALLGTIEMLPFILFTLPAGAWVDRLRRRPIMIVGDLGRALALATIPVAYALGGLTIWQLYVVGFVTGVLTVFFDVSNQSYLPSIVERDQLVDGNSKLQVSLSAAQIAGPGIAGFLVGVAHGAVRHPHRRRLVRALGVLRLPHPAAGAAGRPPGRRDGRAAPVDLERHPRRARVRLPATRRCARSPAARRRRTCSARSRSRR